MKSNFPTARALIAAASCLTLALAAGCLSTGREPAADAWRVVRDISLKQTNAELANMAGFTTRDLGLAATGPNLVLTADGGHGWLSLGKQSLSCVQGMDIVDADTLVADCSCSRAVLTADGGKTWRGIDIRNSVLLSFKDASSGWASDKIGLYAFDGRTVTHVDLPREYYRVSAVACVSADAAYVLDYNGRLGVTRDRGASWLALDSPVTKEGFLLEAKFVGMRFSGPDRGLLVAYDKSALAWREFSTADAGRSWQSRRVSSTGAGTCFISPDLSLITIVHQAYASLVVLEVPPITAEAKAAD
jgi:hypothetical protein